MNVEGAAALVTGANRGLGAAIAQALLDAGAKVYGAARDNTSITNRDVIPVRLDVTSADDIANAARTCGDVSIVVNNAGILRSSTSLAPGAVDAARAEMETNFFGPMRMARAFAPVLRDNGGGALVNVLSVLSFISMPQGATYSASKAAAWSLTNALRIELRRQGTLVVAVHAGFIDTDMAAGVNGEKISPHSVAPQIVAAIEADAEEVLADPTSEMVKAALSNDLTALYPALQATVGRTSDQPMSTTKRKTCRHEPSTSARCVRSNHEGLHHRPLQTSQRCARSRILPTCQPSDPVACPVSRRDERASTLDLIRSHADERVQVVERTSCTSSLVAPGPVTAGTERTSRSSPHRSHVICAVVTHPQLRCSMSSGSLPAP